MLKGPKGVQFTTLQSSSPQSGKAYKGNNKNQLGPHKLCLTILYVVQETEDIEEEVDEIEVKANCPHDVLIRRESVIDEVCVVDDITTEEQSTSNSEYEIEGRAEGDEHANKACHHCHIMRSRVRVA
jgi:hypothetical protein